MPAKFRAALAGVVYCLRTQINMVIHLAAMMAVIGAGWYFHVRPWEWVALAIAITMVLAAEAFNTALEVTVNLYTSKYHPLARIAKDVAAGAVLITALGAVAVAYIIFGPRLGF
ncbi:MAG: diacylglycerol kinase [Moorella sp. (in: firmicutes)]|jgi:diacylglycerol kinase (ATP)|uniref:diacylglycerol kinase family protein n=1 Tax=unclassified Neomoorella TaxID=2676739 RepID=UPI0010FFC186|nr:MULTISPECIES: diacylglycerol kinase family protein [unclassified Moorella (in: firmicutes)]MDK2815810.1 diacylglycerol kinase [Moorella sp. (in: firmicutes)]MDK2895737.1 diacylglycerol kinase [Moorella sp. (in: firmicutes)]GEA16482.1 diacylglycerol kinase [Moorella sp. E308F]GEA17339.1 diacylglycerol kinase [Moorella sp. E306M]